MTTTIKTGSGAFSLQRIRSHSSIFVRHLESNASTVYSKEGYCTTSSTMWPYARVREIRAAVRSMTTEKLEPRQQVQAA